MFVCALLLLLFVVVVSFVCFGGRLFLLFNIDVSDLSVAEQVTYPPFLFISFFLFFICLIALSALG